MRGRAPSGAIQAGASASEAGDPVSSGEALQHGDLRDLLDSRLRVLLHIRHLFFGVCLGAGFPFPSVDENKTIGTWRWSRDSLLTEHATAAHTTDKWLLTCGNKTLGLDRRVDAPLPQNFSFDPGAMRKPCPEASWAHRISDSPVAEHVKPSAVIALPFGNRSCGPAGRSAAL